MTDERNDTVIAEFAKNSREIIRIAVGTFNGHRLAHVRVWAPKPDGSVIPTKAGLSLRLELLPHLISALQQAQEAGGAS